MSAWFPSQAPACARLPVRHRMWIMLGAPVAQVPMAAAIALPLCLLAASRCLLLLLAHMPVRHRMFIMLGAPAPTAAESSAWCVGLVCFCQQLALPARLTGGACVAPAQLVVAAFGPLPLSM